MTMKCPVLFVRVLSFLKEEGREILCWINESDFDPALHEKVDPNAPALPEPVAEPVVEPVVEAPPAPVEAVIAPPAPAPVLVEPVEPAPAPVEPAPVAPPPAV